MLQYSNGKKPIYGTWEIKKLITFLLQLKTTGQLEH